MSNGDQFLGHWKLASSENWDEYMKAAGVGLATRKEANQLTNNKEWKRGGGATQPDVLVTRKVANQLTSYEDWKREGDQWTLHISSTFKSKIVTFKMGEEFDEDTMDGRKVKSLVTLEGDKMVHKQKPTKEGELDSTVTREILDDGRLLVTFVAENKGLTAKRYFTSHKP
ncbi:fatty acid-binding protein, adipocyte-like [Littorina saxatilis]|uniref:fatty acid-binding protein, adipocyte-like n=1 Tax=Littorina saxatilis TaxID=31220 RepID=UPI0038B5BF1A